MISTASANEENVTADNSIDNTISQDIDDTIFVDDEIDNTEDVADIKSENITKKTTTQEKQANNTQLTKEDPEIRIAGAEIHPGQTKTFLVLLPDDATGVSIFKIDNTIISEKLSVSDGLVLYTYTIPTTFDKEKYTLYFVYSGDDKYNFKKVNATLTLTPEGGKTYANMTLPDYKYAKYLMEKKIVLTLNKNATGTVVFRVGEKKVSGAIKIDNGKVIFNYTPKVMPGKYVLSAEYCGNYMYYPTVVNATITVNKLKTFIEVTPVTSKPGQYTKFTAKVTDEIGRVVPNMKVKFKIKDLDIGSNKTDKNGLVTYYYPLSPALTKQEYNITAISYAKNTVAASKNMSTLKLKQLKTKVMVPDISAIPSKYVTITATVVDEFNNSVRTGYVTFKKNGTTITKVKVSNGYAKYKYETNYQTSTSTYLYAYYTGDFKYANSDGKGNFTITKLKTTMSLGAIDAKANEKVSFSARIRDQNQNYVTEGNVTFKLDNKVIGTAEVKNGLAYMMYQLNTKPVGTYHISAEYEGSLVYKECSDINLLTVSLYSTTTKTSAINGVAGESTSITVTVTDEEKYNVEKGTVKFYVNNEYIGDATVNDGSATLNYVVPSKYDGKTVKYYVTYDKNDIYDSSSSSDVIVVSHQKIVYVSTTGSDSNLGDKAHPYKTLKYAAGHVTLFGTIYIGEGTFSASGIQLNTSVSIIGSGRGKTIIDGGNNGETVFNITKRNAVLTMKSLTIKNAKSNHEFSAGAIVTSGKLNIEYVAFVNNVGNGNFSGGAIYTNGILNLTNCEFTNNVVTNINSQGGAIRCYSNTTYITKCKFDSNKVTGSNSTGGSVIYCDGGDVIINQTTFTKNTVKGKYVTGGVIRTVFGAVVIDNSTFTDNTITATDYAMGGIIGSLSSGVSIQNSVIKSNTITATNTAGGSVAYVEVAALEIKNTNMNSNKLVSNNTYGGIIYAYKAMTTLTGNTISSTTMEAKNYGFGGALYAYMGNMTIDKTKFTSNTIKAKNVALGGAIYSTSTITITNSDFTNNNINASNLGGGAIANMGILVITHSNFINNSAYEAGDAITTTNTSINIVENNYWGSASPSWSKLLNSLKQPENYSKTKFNN